MLAVEHLKESASVRSRKNERWKYFTWEDVGVGRDVTMAVLVQLWTVEWPDADVAFLADGKEFLDGFEDENEGNEGGKAFFGEAGDELDQVGRVGGHHDEQEETCPYPNPETQRKVLQTICSTQEENSRQTQSPRFQKIILLWKKSSNKISSNFQRHKLQVLTIFLSTVHQ